MATLRSAIKTLLAGDATLAAILTGGVYDRRGISRALTPAAYDTTTGKIKPCAVVTISSETAAGIGSEETTTYQTDEVFVQVWLYEAEGNHYANIDPAADRVKALLDRQAVTITGGAVLGVRYADGIGDSFDEALGVEMSALRFQVWRHRT